MKTKYDKIQEIVEAWIQSADLDTIYEYAGDKYSEWLNEQDTKFINETHEEFCGLPEYMKEEVDHSKDVIEF
jgi:hypothetical protein